MSDMLYRSFAPDLEVRSGGDGRTVHGIAVPYNAPQRINGELTEQFARGAFNHQLRAANRVRFAREHVDLGGVLIGAAKTMRDDAAGLYVELRASKTPEGDATLELIKDGALPHLSVGYREGRNRRVPGTNTVERVVAHLFEIAATMEGAFGDLAPIGGVRDASGTQLDGHAVGVEFCPECTHCTTPAGLDQARQILADLPALAA
jgi:HK97 family phage prohead protease